MPTDYKPTCTAHVIADIAIAVLGVISWVLEQLLDISMSISNAVNESSPPAEAASPKNRKKYEPMFLEKVFTKVLVYLFVAIAWVLEILLEINMAIRNAIRRSS